MDNGWIADNGLEALEDKDEDEDEDRCFMRRRRKKGVDSIFQFVFLFPSRAVDMLLMRMDLWRLSQPRRRRTKRVRAPSLTVPSRQPLHKCAVSLRNELSHK